MKLSHSKMPLLLMILAFGCSTLYALGSQIDQLLREGDITELHAERILSSFEEVAAQGLSVEPLLDRLREGVLKRAQPGIVATAVENRANSLSRAQSMIGTRPAQRHGRDEATDLLIMLARALEVGVPPAVFDVLFAPTGEVVTYRDQALIEAAEMLFLSGTAQEDIERFIESAWHQELRRMEILRAAHLWIQKQAEGLAPADIHNQLWTSPHRTPGQGEGRGRRMQQRQR